MYMQKRRIIIGIIIIALSCGIYLYPSFEKLRFEQEMDQVMDIYWRSDMSKDYTDTLYKDTSCTDISYIENEYDRPYLELYQEMKAYNERLVAEGQNLTDCWSYIQNPISMSNIPSDDDVIGYVTIPDMDVELPLLIGASVENLGKGAAVLNETSMPVGGENTNCVIAGHRGYKGMPYFRNIEDLKAGSSVYITNPWGTMAYVVTGIKIISPYDSASIEIQEGKDMVTLLTCHPYMSHGKYRYLVFCERAESVPVSLVEQIKEEISVETGEGVDSSDLEGEQDYSRKLIYLEDGLRILLPVLGILIIVTSVVSRGKDRKKNDGKFF